MTTTQDRAQGAASTAADEGKKVAGTAKDEAQNVAAEAKSQVSGLMGEAMTQVQEQSRTQRDRLVTTLQSLSDDLEQMAGQSQGSGLAADLARQVADRTRSLGSHLDGREPADLLEDVRSFARRKPGMFLVGALAAGVVAGRITRGAKAARSSDTGSLPSGGYDTSALPPASPSPTLATTPPPVDTGTSTPSYGQQEIASPGQPTIESGSAVGSTPTTGDPLSDPLGGDLPGRSTP